MRTVSAVVVLASFVSAQTTQELALPDAPSAPFTVALAIDGDTVSLELSPHSLRSSDFQLVVQGADGALRATDAPAAATVRGAVAGRPGSVVAGSLVDGQLTALVRIDGRLFGIEPLAGSEHAVGLAEAIRPDAGFCLALPPDGGPPPMAEGATVPKQAEVGIDSDVEYFQAFGSVAATTADIESVMNAVQAIYMTDADVYNVITAIVIRTAEPDPYTSSNASALLNQIAAEWQTNLAGVQRDLVQMFTGKNLDGGIVGIAFPTGLCDPATQYSAVQSLFTPVFSSRVTLSAHEMGHTWGAPHCNASPDCGVMCAVLGGCGGDPLSFGSNTLAVIEAQKSSAPCLDDACGPFSYGLAEGNVTTLTGTGTGAIGTPLTITYADPPSAPSTAFAVIASDLGNQSIGAGVILFDIGSIVAFAPTVTFTTLADTPSQVFNVPNNAALVGTDFFFQAAHFAGGPVTGLSNGVAVIFCD